MALKKTDKKPVAKKPATKVAAKATAAKKPAPKAAAVKKPATKVATKATTAKTATTKPAPKAAAKKPATKVATKATTAKTAAAKPAPKAAAKKPEVKAATTKPAVKAATTKPAAKPTAAIAAPKAAAKGEAKAAGKTTAAISDVKYRSLFDAYASGKLPIDQGYIISSFFDEKSFYSRFEVVTYAGVKEIHPSSSGLQFISNGKKLHILLEPDTYPRKFQEPGNRTEDERIPLRFAELDKITAKNQTSIYIAKKAIEIAGSFTVLKPFGLNFSIVFYDRPDLYASIKEFFTNIFNKQRKVPEFDAKKAADQIAKTVETSMGFEGEFSNSQ